MKSDRSHEEFVDLQWQVPAVRGPIHNAGFLGNFAYASAHRDRSCGRREWLWVPENL